VLALTARKKRIGVVEYAEIQRMLWF
jgi:hypothetical protein